MRPSSDWSTSTFSILSWFISIVCRGKQAGFVDDPVVGCAEWARLKMRPSPRRRAAWPRSPRRAAEPRRAELIDGTAQRAGQRAAEIGHPNAGNACVGLDLQGDDRPLRIRVFRGVGERLVGRKGDNRRADGGDLHGFSPCTGNGESCTLRLATPARSGLRPPDRRACGDVAAEGQGIAYDADWRETAAGTADED